MRSIITIDLISSLRLFKRASQLFSSVLLLWMYPLSQLPADCWWTRSCETPSRRRPVRIQGSSWIPHICSNCAAPQLRGWCHSAGSSWWLCCCLETHIHTRVKEVKLIRPSAAQTKKERCHNKHDQQMMLCWISFDTEMTCISVQISQIFLTNHCVYWHLYE